MTQKNKINSIHDLLNQFRDMAENNRDMGTKFEQLMKSYFELDPIYKDKFKKVSMWSDWEYAEGGDNGIDLVAEGTDGEFTAIQCKFYSPDTQVMKKNIDSFFTESGKTFQVNKKKRTFTGKIIVCTSDNWSKEAEDAVKKQAIIPQRIRVQDLDSSPIDWSKFSLEKPDKLVLKDKKKLRKHQQEAINDVLKGFKTHDRGKLIMACGTGKTYTALKLVETSVPKNGIVLFLVPSISLMSQTLREWTAESENSFHAFAVCSDKKIGKDNEDSDRHDLAIPATTDTASLIKGLEATKSDKKLTVIFSTYQSIDVVSQAQKKGLPEFDIIICDEAHRTTGATLADKEDSTFVTVHDQKKIKAKKRLYMTATPRIFGDAVKSKAKEAGAELFSMDDEAKYGPEFHRLGFGKAVSEQLLTDYKVLVLAVDERIINSKFQRKFANEEGEIPLEDIARIIGCWNGLSKKFLGEEAAVEDGLPMKRAVAFASTIPYSKRIANVFQGVVKEYIAKNNAKGALNCELEHVDGTFNVLLRNKRLDWLKEEAPDNTCRILTNARCLSEGVDVPALDAVLFLNPRKSMVDVVQSVGRIMRRAEGKKYGYVILPIGIPAGTPPEESLKDNKKYEIVWQVLQALRAHDDRFDAEINKLDLNNGKSSKIQIIGVGGGDGTGGDTVNTPTQIPFNMPEIEDWKDAIYAKIVLKCGSRPYWENWAADVAKIAEKHTDHIKKLLASKEPKSTKAFDKFLKGIQKNINPSISAEEAIEMLSQHLITKPVFDALFEHYPFTEKNPVSQSMQAVLKFLEAGSFKEDAAKLKSFYDSVRMRVKGIDNAEGRQRIIVELYDRFFKVAFPKMSERLGIVYTPVEVVDFIINSVEAVLKDEFGQSLSDKNVHILDPFTGTGTFIVRLLQSGIIKPEDLKRKFKSELHANEIVLLAYYIAAINIEETYHGITGGEYTPFDGVVLTDTFQLSEDEAQGTFESALPENSERVERQKRAPIQVIISNPPYSAGQRDANDNNQNLEYPKLDMRIRDTYARESSATLKNSLYDSYIRGIRWATDRLGEYGVIGFVTNGGFIDSNAADGLRKAIGKEFSRIYCFNLRGNARTQGEDRRKEKGNVFGEGTRTPVAITLLIKRKDQSSPCEIKYHDIGDYLSREEKLKIIHDFGSIKNIKWEAITPNQEGDWINQRSVEYENYTSVGDKKNGDDSIFEIYSRGVATSRDNWVFNFNKSELRSNMTEMISFYNNEVERFKNAFGTKAKDKWPDPEDFVNSDSKKIKWSRELFWDVAAFKKYSFEISSLVLSVYRPFTKQHLYFNRRFNNTIYLLPKLFPTEQHANVVFALTGSGSTKPFSVFISSLIPDLEMISKGQCFPLYYYEKPEEGETADLLKANEKPDKHGYIKRDAITDFALEMFQKSYNDKKITKEDIFYYVYGLLHSPTYRSKYQNDLKKMLPRIPIVKDFWGYSKTGRDLAEYHLNYETVEPYNLKEEIGEGAPKKAKELYRVNETGMKFPKVKKEEDRTTIIFNPHVTLKGIPLEAYDYVVNGKSAIEWVMERYAVTTDKDSGIKNDPNEWSDDPRYIVDLVKRVVRVSIETNRLVGELPKFELLEETKK
jgi:predicted helicase